MRLAQCLRTTELLCLFDRVFLVRFDSHIYRRAETRGPGRSPLAAEFPATEEPRRQLELERRGFKKWNQSDKFRPWTTAFLRQVLCECFPFPAGIAANRGHISGQAPSHLSLLPTVP